MFSHIAIIFNPNSTGPSQDLAETLARTLKAAGLDNVSLQPTQAPGHAEQLGYELACKHARPLIISSSGDGGYHEVVNGVMRARAQGHGAVCAVLPAGNANDHRRTLGRRPLCRGIISGKTTRIDLLRARITPPGGESTVRYAHSYIGLGLTPVVATELNRHSLNAWREMIIVLRAFWRLQPFQIRTGGQQVAYDSLIFSNINSMAKALTIAKDSRPNDGLVEITYFPAGSKLGLLGHLIKAATVGLRSNLRQPQYKFEVVEPVLVQLDGEVTDLTTGTQVVIDIDHAGLETIL